MSMKKLVRYMLRKVGLEVRRIRPRDTAFMKYGGNQWDFSKISELKLEPEIVVDVGVAKGTPELYSAFPYAKLFLVEPIAEFNSDIRELVAQRSYTLVNRAAGKEPSTLRLYWNQQRPAQTSLYQRTMHTGQSYEVEVETLDQILKDVNSQKMIIKIDVEGAELDVLVGAEKALENAIGVFVEVNLGFGFSEPRNSLPEVDAILHSAGFKLHSIMDAVRRGSSFGLSIQKADLFYLKGV